MSSFIGALISIVVLIVGLGLVTSLFYAGYKLSTRVTKVVGWQIFLTFLFGFIFNIGLVTAAVAGCFAIVGGTNFH